MFSSSEGYTADPGKSARPHPVQLKDIVVTSRLAERNRREPNWKDQAIALATLAKVLATTPVQLMDTLLDTAIQLCGAETAGLSVQETSPDGEQIFRWTHLAGRLKEHIGGSTPRNFSPCGLCTDTQAPQLFSHPELYFTYFAAAKVPFVEALVIPVRVGQTIPATIWILSHTAGNGFDAEDVRIMQELADFTGCALGLLPADENSPEAAAKRANEKSRKDETVLGEEQDDFVSLSKARSAQLQQLSLKLINARDEERMRVARDLRDKAGQYLAGLAMSLSLLLRDKSSLTSVQESQLGESLRMVHRCTSEIRNISSMLHPPSLDEEGLFTAITWYAEGFAQRSGIPVNFECPTELGRFPREMEVAIFRIVQEALENIEHHSGSASATVRISAVSGVVHMEIRDEGHGMPAGTLSGIMMGTHLAGVGLATMRERVSTLGGTFRVRSNQQGTTVEANVPVTSQLLRV